LKTIHKDEPLFKLGRKREKTNTDEIVEKERFALANEAFTVLYLVFIAIFTIAVLLELKSEYQIDLFPGVNTPFDDAYFGLKERITGQPNAPGAAPSPPGP
jgi:hypothetical protein